MQGVAITDGLGAEAFGGKDAKLGFDWDSLSFHSRGGLIQYTYNWATGNDGWAPGAILASTPGNMDHEVTHMFQWHMVGDTATALGHYVMNLSLGL